ncbi:MAG: GHMP family kinase ATP-binding protein [Anaerolineales bacterium]
MSIQLSVPARINLLGNPSDGNEGAHATISAAVDLRAYAEIESHKKYIFKLKGSDTPSIEFDPSELPIPYQGHTDLLNASINRLFAFSPEFRSRIFKRGFLLRVWSDVPRQSGLGGSSLFVLLTLAAMREFYELDRQIHNDYLISELAQRIEEIELGITCGFADRYVPLFGGLAYIDYHGKLEHKPIGDEPFATYEQLDHHVASLPLVGIVTGVQHESGDVHGRMRSLYLEQHAQWQQIGGDMPPMVSYMHSAWACAWQGKIALLEGDLVLFGQLMNENHQLVDAMMRYCGFEDGAGWANNLFIQVAHENGALGAKLTGAGGGGSVFALVNPGAEDELISAWENAAAENNLKKAQVHKFSISPRGLIVDHQ